MDKWLECNGQSISSTVYPELFALVGGNVPDYRGLFLRGLGGKSGPLQQKQEEGVYIAPGTATQTIHGVRNDRLMLGNAAGASYELFDSGSTALFTGTWDEWGNHPFPGNNSATFNTSITSSATETRPANMAVRYLIRALP
jgi:hypothetical protein